MAELRTLIAEGRYAAGDRLPPERDLAATLGVSRSTIRDAIGRLTQDGTVEARQGSGTFVASVDLRHVFDVRLQLEPFAAAAAAGNRSGRDIEVLEGLLKRLEESIDDATDFAEIDAQLHAGVAAAAGNQVLIDVLDRLGGLARLSRAMTALERGVRVEALPHLRKLVEAIRNGDSDAAAAAMRRHLEAVLTVVSSHDRGQRADVDVRRLRTRHEDRMSPQGEASPSAD